jgi:hypothetical protein
MSTIVRVLILPVVSNSRSNCFADLERDTQVDYQSDIPSEYLNIVFTNIRSRGKLTENPSRGRSNCSDPYGHVRQGEKL